jgi:molybdopterin-binding protein
MSLIEVQRLCKEYSGRQVLKDVSFEVQHGEIFVLVGPNGAGKTTLLRILDLLEEPTRGTIRIDGTAIDYLAQNRVTLRRRIGMVFQKTVLFNTTVSKNVAYPLNVKGENERETEKRVKETLKIVQLEGFENKNALKLSGGEAQRVALAQSLIIKPDLLLLDEPTANLDPRNLSIVEEVLSWTNREDKTTIIMATHNMSQAENLANRAALLMEGKIERTGKFREIFSSQSKLLADFARLENIFQGVSRITEEGTSIISVGEGLDIEAAFRKSGNTAIYVRPEDIILSAQPLVSSARNAFKGKITEITDSGPVVKLKVKAGKDFTVQVTKRSFNEMQLNLDSSVFLAFKASSVQIV